jgi:hypothetical protein
MEETIMKKINITRKKLSLLIIALSVFLLPVTMTNAWWVGYYAGFEVNQFDPSNSPECDLLPVGIPECYPVPDGTVFGAKIIINNLHRLYRYDIQANGIGWEHLKVFRVLDSDLTYNTAPQDPSDYLYFRYGYDLDLASGYTQIYRERAWMGFEVDRYGHGENSAWVFEFTGVTASFAEISLTLDFLFLMQNRGTHPSVDSPPTIQVFTSFGLVGSSYIDY